MSGTTTIAANSGFFFNDPATPSTAASLTASLAAAQANLAAAGTSATASAASAAAASNSATAASSSATTASAAIPSATAAANSATNAASSATAASTSATNAASSATAASTSATNAAASATSAAGSVTSASAQATNAGTSATAAANSATTAGTSATAAANSATAAANSATTAGASAATASAVNVGRNKLHNALFNVAQRGAGPFTTSGYGLDRWINSMSHSTGSAGISQAALSDSDRASIGDEEAKFALDYVFTGGTGAGDYDVVAQRIENVRRLSGKTVTVSFWANCLTGTPKVGIGLTQAFGTGGSPSASVNVAAQAATIATTWARYSATFSVPSTSGKTLGTNGDSYTELDLWLSSGSANNVRAGSIGVQSNTVNFWGVQLEIGSAATPLEKLDYQLELARCQRFYETFTINMRAYITAGTQFDTTGYYKSTKRSSPTVAVVAAGVANNVSGGISVTPSADSCRFEMTSTALGDTYAIGYVYGASADL